MTAQNQDFSMNEGESKKIVVDQTTDEDNSNNNLDISGRQELKWVLRDARDSSGIVEKTESGSSDVTVTDTSVGAYEIVIVPSDTNDILNKSKETFYHKVRITDSSGDESDLLEGEITISAS